MSESSRFSSMEDRGTSVSDSMPELVRLWLLLERKDGGGGRRGYSEACHGVIDWSRDC